MGKLKTYSADIEDQISSLDELIVRAKSVKKNSLDEDIAQKLWELLRIRKQLLSEKNKSYRILSRPPEKVLKIINSELSFLQHKELVEQAGRLILDVMKYKLALDLMKAENKYLIAYFKSNETRRIEKSANKQTGKEKKFKSNKECLTACLEKLKKERKRELKDTDYARFRSIVISVPAPYQPKPRENAEDKALSSEDREKNLEQKLEERRAHNGWAPSSIYDFWIKTTGLKATTKKSSSLKC